MLAWNAGKLIFWRLFFTIVLLIINLYQLKCKYDNPKILGSLGKIIYFFYSNYCCEGDWQHHFCRYPSVAIPFCKYAAGFIYLPYMHMLQLNVPFLDIWTDIKLCIVLVFIVLGRCICILFMNISTEKDEIILTTRLYFLFCAHSIALESILSYTHKPQGSTKVLHSEKA